MRRRIVTALTLALALAVTSAAVLPISPAVAESRSGSDIVQTLVQRSGGGVPDSNPRDYDILIQAVLAAGLAGTLSDPSTRFTVFAPNDAAFMATVGELTGSRPASD